MRWLERQRCFLDLALSALLRRRWKNLSLVTLYALIVFLLASVLFFGEALRREAERVLSGAPEMIVQRLVAGRHDLIPLAYAEKIAAIRGVRKVTGRLWGYYYHPASGANYTVMGTGDFGLGPYEAVVGEGVRRTWSGIDDEHLVMRAADGVPVLLRIAGEFAADTALVSADLILVGEQTFRRIFGIPPGYAVDLAAEIRNLNECPVIAEKTVARLPDTRPVLREEIRRTYQSLFDWRSGYVVVMLAGAVLAFFIFAWDRAAGLSADEKAEIGILKAVGWETADVLQLKFWEGLAVSLAAFTAGAAAAYAHVFVAHAPLFEHALKGWAVLYPDFRLTPEVSAFQLAVVFGLTVVPYALVTVVPAWRVAVTDPDEVMR